MKTFWRAALATPFLLLFTFASLAQTGSKSGTGANIDVVYHRAEWTINPDAAKNITGTVTTYFKTTQANVSTINFDLDKAAFNNANLIVKYHGSTTGVVKSFPASGNLNILNIKLPIILPLNRLDSVTISYSGAPPAFNTYGEGYEKNNLSSPSTAVGNVIYTLAESYGDDDWWPCKADMQDKVDSMDFIITTPSAFRAATNGVLISDVVIGSDRIMKYKHRYPIASYLVAVGVAKYTVFNRPPVTINGTSVPIVYYIYSGRGNNPTTQLTAMDFCRDELVAFSEKFGDYPFKNEKYGMYEFGWGGGMEHQTFSAMDWGAMSSWHIIAHELAHQWFGDKVTFATWNHLWLAEGFANYSEVLAAELVSGLNVTPYSHRLGIKNKALSYSTTPVYLSNASIANSGTIWTAANSAAIYQRGAMVISMLRKLAGDDKFFQALKNYLADPALAYKSATTEILRDHFEAVLGYDLDAFFQDYIYGTGNPAYDINWGSATNSKSINIELTTQRRSTSSTVSYFRTPVVLKISNATKDTTVVIYDENGKVSYAGNGIRQSHTGKVLGYNLSFVPTTVTVDPDAETLVRGQDGTTARSTVTKLASLNMAPMFLLPISILDFKGQQRAEGNYLSLQLTTTDENISVMLERSENGVHFSFAGNMLKNAFNSSKINYNFLDNHITSAQTYYYRVKTIDEAGLVKYSKIISIASESVSAVVELSPNPASSVVQITLSAAWQSGPFSYTIYNGTGAVIKKERRKNAGSQIRIQVQQFPSGSYNIKLVGAGGLQVVKTFAVIH